MLFRRAFFAFCSYFISVTLVFRLFFHIDRQFFHYIPLVICNQKCGERKCNDKSDEAEQRSPYRERQEQDGWVESHSLAHNLRCKHHVGNGLHDDEYKNSRTEYYPEILARVNSLESRQQYHWYEGESVQVGHKAEQSYQNAKTYCHRKPNDGEANAEEDADAQGNKALSAHVTVELGFHVFLERPPERAALWGKHTQETGREGLVVEQNEEQVYQCHHRCDDTYNYRGGLGDNLKQARHQLPDGVRHLLFLEELLNLFAVIVNPLAYGEREVLDMCCLVEIARHQFAQFLKLFNHRRNDEVNDTSYHPNHHKQRDDY